MKKKAIFLLNYVSELDTQHFVHTFNLLDKLELHCGWNIAVFSEKGGKQSRFIFDRKIIFLSNKNKIVRYLNLIYWMFKYRKYGFKVIYIRISKMSAIVASIIGKIIGIKVLYWQSGTVDDWNRTLNLRVRIVDFLLTSLALRLIDGFLTGPESMINYYTNLYPFLNKKINLLYNDIDLSRFSNCALAHKKNIGFGGITFLMVHRFSPVRETTKYFPEILSALEKLTYSFGYVRLIMVGDGPELPFLKALSLDKKNIDIKFLGPLPNIGIEKIYKVADIFLMPSFREGFPRVILEAMAMGLPIVSTDAGGSRDIVGNLQRDYFADRRFPVEFAEKILALSLNFYAQKEISKENLQIISRFSTEKIAEMCDDILLKYI